MDKNSALSIDDYISRYPPEVQQLLISLRNTIRKAAPKAQEKISYDMPAFTLYGVLVYFAAYKNHIGFYPTASGIREFQKELSGYKTSKGTVQFPVDKPLPKALIRKMVEFRVQENLKKHSLK